jgi:hypothetical protein
VKVRLRYGAKYRFGFQSLLQIEQLKDQMLSKMSDRSLALSDLSVSPMITVIDKAAGMRASFRVP